MKNAITITICLIALLLSTPVFAKEKIAVMELEALGGVDASLVEIMTNTLKDQLHAAGKYTIVSREEIEALANRLALQQQSGDCTSTDCLADMGKVLGTKLMVYGSISKIGKTYSLSLRLLDTESKEAINRINELCKCSEEDIFETVKIAAAKLMGTKDPYIAEKSENRIDLQDVAWDKGAGITEKNESANGLNVVMETSMGTIKIELFDKEAPLSAENFRNYVKQGYYDGLVFHRVIPGFMIQGGGFEPGMKKKTTGRPIPNEATNGLKNKRGTLSMARTSDIHSATSQFFINVVENVSLDHTGTQSHNFGYAVFGKIVAGMDVADKIVSAPTTRVGSYRDVPKKDIVIIKAYLE